MLRLKAEARLSDREIAAAIGSARSTVQECLRRARAAGVGWPLPLECDDEDLLARLYPRAAAPARYPTPDFAAVHAELARKGVTRMLLWQEYRARHPEGCQYSAFCRDYDAWLGRQDAALRARAGRQAVRRLRGARDEHRRSQAELERYNDRPLSHGEGTRRSRYLELVRPALKPLPAERYQFATWKNAKVHLDYHVEFERRYYSVPYRLIG